MAIFEFKDGQHYHGMWRAIFNGGDFLAFMWREDGRWIFRYRFRYFKDAKVWESDDERSTYQVSMPDDPGNRERMFEGVNAMLSISSKSGMCSNLTYYPCDGDAEAMIAIVSETDGIHVKSMSNEEHEEYMRTKKLPKTDPNQRVQLLTVIAKMRDHFDAYQTSGGDDRVNLGFKMARIIRGYNETSKRRLLPTTIFRMIEDFEHKLTDRKNPLAAEAVAIKLLNALERSANDM